VHFESRVVVPAGATAGTDVEVAVPRAQLPAGDARLEVAASLEGAATQLRAPLFLLALRADSIRVMLERDAAQLETGDAQALASLHARIAVLADEPDEANSAQFLADPVALASALQEEIAALQAGRDPYRRTGDIWRVLQMPTGHVPIRIYIPPQARAAQDLPLVIALHGAGADENMFLEGYGHGRLRHLADSLGFLVASPNTVEFARDPATLDTLLAVVARTNRFDRRRVYVLGHSLGGGVTLRLAFQRRGDIRAAAIIAGAGTVPATQTVVPTLFLAAERDLVIPAARVQASFAALQSRGAPVAYWLAEGWGHTLVVGIALDRALAFLLEEHRNP
jgi:predicted esterase